MEHNNKKEIHSDTIKSNKAVTERVADKAKLTVAKTKTKAKKLNAEATTAQKSAAGVALTAAVVAGVGAYFFYGSNKAGENRMKAKSWMLKAKGEVMEKVEQAKKMSKDDYEEIVDSVVQGYLALKVATKKEAGELTEELKNSWKRIDKVAKDTAKVTKGKVEKKTK